MNDSNGTLGDEVAAEFRGEDLAETIRRAEEEAAHGLLARMDRAHTNALALMTDQVEMLLSRFGDDPDTKGQAVSIHALSILSTFASLRNSASQACIAHEMRQRTVQLEEVSEGLAKGWEEAKSVAARGGE